MTEFFTKGDIAKQIGLTGQAISAAVQRHELQPTAKTKGGISLFDKKTVDQFLQNRKQSDRK